MARVQNDINNTWMNEILTKIIENLKNKGDMQQKESMLYLLCALHKKIIINGRILIYMEKILMQHAFSELSNNTALMQHTTMLLYEKYYKLFFKDQEHSQSLINTILINLNNSHPAVAVQAGITLRFYTKKQYC